MKRPVRIANISGFYGDRPVAAREVLDGPDPIDVLTGDYLAELTMLILHKARRKDPAAGYASTFATQMSHTLVDCLDRGIKVVANAGGLHPHGLADRVREIAAELGRSVRIAVVDGDDVLGLLDRLQASGEPLTHLDTGIALAAAGVSPVSANAYLGGFGIAAALTHADIVITGRVTDAALVLGPAAWWHGWQQGDLGPLAGAVVAGHIIECGPQATGGNYSFADRDGIDLRYPGYPIAEVAADGSSVITKQPGSGGAVTVGTVTAQLLYEIAEPAYANPDVVARFDTISLTQQGPDRVAVGPVVGDPPSGRLKVALNYIGGWRNTMSVVLTGLDIDEKAERAQALLADVLGGWEQFASVDVRRSGSELRFTVKDPDRAKVGRRFSNAVMELLLGSYAGAYATSPPTDASEYGVYWPTTIPVSAVTHTVTMPDGTVTIVPPPTETDVRRERAIDEGATSLVGPTSGRTAGADGPTVAAPIGAVCGARSGDKGGNANVGLWARTEACYRWLVDTLTEAKLREVLPEAADLQIRRFELPNLRAVNFVIIGLLGQGVASSVRVDPQAKALGEHLRAQILDIPAALLR